MCMASKDLQSDRPGMIRPVSHRETGFAFDLAEVPQPAEVLEFLRDLRENLPHDRHGLICESAGGDEQDKAVFVVRRPGGGFSVRHYPGHAHEGSHDVIPESDEHKRGKAYAAAELQRLGLPAGQEVRTNTKVRLDVATLDAPRITGVEFQAYEQIEDHEYKRRTTSAMRATAFTGRHARTLPDGVLPLWVHAFGMPRGWSYPVPSIAAQDTRWDAMPKPGSVTAIGVRVIEAERCRPGSRWDRCPISSRGFCGEPHPWAELQPGLKVGEVAAMIAQAELVPLRYFNGAVYLVTPQDADLYDELGGRGAYVTGPAGERPSARRLGPCRNYRHTRPPVTPPAPSAPTPLAYPGGDTTASCPFCGAEVSPGPATCCDRGRTQHVDEERTSWREYAWQRSDRLRHERQLAHAKHPADATEINSAESAESNWDAHATAGLSQLQQRDAATPAPGPPPATERLRPRMCPLCNREHACCEFTRGSLYCVVPDCENPHHRRKEQ
jgi:hypothetical protein